MLTIADEALCSKRQAIRCIESLEAQGFIGCLKSNGMRTRYTLNMGGSGDAHVTGDTHDTGDTHVTPTGDTHVTAPVTPMSPEPGSNQEENQERGSRRGKPSKFHQAVIDAYHDCLPNHPGVRIWNTKRQRTLDRARKEYPKCDDLAWWPRYFAYVAKSEFLMGKNDRGWTPDLEWLCDVTRLTKVLEGKYHGEGA